MTKLCTICLREGHHANNCPDGEAFRRSRSVESESTLKRERVLTEIIKAGESGINSGELRAITGYGVGSVDCALCQLSAKGLVFLGGHGTGMRRFSRQEWADAYHTRTSLDVAIDRVAHILANAGDEGISTPDLSALMGLEARRLSEALIAIRRAGRAFFAGKNHTFRNFATEEQANAYAVKSAQRRLDLKRQNDRAHKQAWLAKQPPKVKAEKPPKPPKVKVEKPKEKRGAKLAAITHERRMSLAADKSIKAKSPDFADVKPINPHNVEPIVIPSKPGRFEVSGRVVGGFATMRPGQYIQADTWAARALGGR